MASYGTPAYWCGSAGYVNGSSSRARAKLPPERREVRIARPLAKLAPGRRTVAIARQLPKLATEKARGTYRKTAARFEEFAYDAQMPESMRALAEKSVAQTREFYVHSLEAVLESWERFVVAAGQGTVALNRKAIDIALRNIIRLRSSGKVGRGEERC